MLENTDFINKGCNLKILCLNYMNIGYSIKCDYRVYDFKITFRNHFNLHIILYFLVGDRSVCEYSCGHVTTWTVLC